MRIYYTLLGILSAFLLSAADVQAMEEEGRTGLATSKTSKREVILSPALNVPDVYITDDGNTLHIDGYNNPWFVTENGLDKGKILPAIREALKRPTIIKVYLSARYTSEVTYGDLSQAIAENLRIKTLVLPTYATKIELETEIKAHWLRIFKNNSGLKIIAGEKTPKSEEITFLIP